MNTVRTTTRTRTAAFRIRRLLAVLSLAIALVAIPTFNPADASALRMSEWRAAAACGRAGGTLAYSFYDPQLRSYDMFCTLPSGAGFMCAGYGRFVDCY